MPKPTIPNEKKNKALAVVLVANVPKSPLSYTSRTTGSLSIINPNIIGSNKKSMAFIVTLTVSPKSSSALLVVSLAILGKMTFAIESTKTPTMIV